MRHLRCALTRVLVSMSIAAGTPPAPPTPTPTTTAFPTATVSPYQSTVQAAAQGGARGGAQQGGGHGVKPVPEVVMPAPGRVEVPMGPSLAAADTPDRPEAVRAPQVTVPAGPELVDQVVRQAADRLRQAGFPQGRPAVHDLLPATDDASGLSLKRLPGKALSSLGRLSGKAMPSLGLPGGALPSLGGLAGKAGSSLTYRLCARSGGLPVSCSAAHPLAVPAAADVTGDGVPDLAAVLAPATAKGVTFTVRRLGGPLTAQVWAEYAIPGAGLLSAGLTGEIPRQERAVYTVAEGRVTVDVRRTGPGSSATTIAALGGTLVSLRQSPAPARFTATATLPARKVVLAASSPARLDALLVNGGDVTQLTLARVSAKAGIELTPGRAGTKAGAEANPGRAEGKGGHETGGLMTIAFTGSVGRAELHRYGYRDGVLQRAVNVTIDRLPSAFSVAFSGQTLTVTSATPHPARAGVRLFDRAAARTVMRADLAGLPARLRLHHDLAANRVTYTASGAVGSVAATLQRNGGAIARPNGAHLTMIKKADQLGVSGRLSGLSGLDVAYGPTPHALLRLDPAVDGSFRGGASIDDTHVAALEISNTPATVEVDLDPAAGTARYRADGTIARLRAAYTNPRSGLTAEGIVHGVRSAVSASWRLGARSTAEVTTKGPLKRLVLRASKGERDSVATTVRGVRGRLAVVADTTAGTLSWTSAHPVTSVDARARTSVSGRPFSVAARVTGVPTSFQARWGPGGYGFTGRLGEAIIAVTNHEGATAPAGPHLAAHHNAETGDLDASVHVRGLRSVTFTPSAAGFTADVRAARQRLALDADLLLPGGIRAGALGTLGPLPGRLSVSSAGGPITYTSDTSLGLRARLWFGKAAALAQVRDAPAVKDGFSLVDGTCARVGEGQDVQARADGGHGQPNCGDCARPERGGREGPECGGCAGPDCVGVRAFVDVSGLPTAVTVDPARKTFTFSGLRTRHRALRLLLDSTALAPVPIRASAVLTGLPAAVTQLSVGPFDTAGAAYRVEPVATLGSLRVRVQSGQARGEVAISPVPAAVSVSGVYGTRTSIRVANSAPVKRLTAAVTLPEGTSAVRLTDVPARFGIDAQTAGDGLRVPALTYRADAGTLDGDLTLATTPPPPTADDARETPQVDDARKSPQAGDAGTSVQGAGVSFTDLAATTTIAVRPDLSVDVSSHPNPTRRLEVRAGLAIAPVARQRVAFARELPYTGGLVGYEMAGDFALGRSSIDELKLAVHDLRWLRIRPGKIPFGLKAPPALGYVSPGFEGAYGRLDLRATGVDLNPDVRLGVKVSRKIGPEVFSDSLRLTHADSVRMRRYDQQLRLLSAKQAIMAGRVPVACVTLGTRPGLVSARGRNAVTLYGKAGPQLVSLLDPGGQVPGYALDLLAHFMSPFPGQEWTVSEMKTGSC